MSNSAALLRRSVSPFVAAAALVLGAFGCQPAAPADYPGPAPLSRLPAVAALHLDAGVHFTPGAAPVPESDAAILLSPKIHVDPKLRMWTDWEGEALPGVLRSRKAKESRLPVVKELFDKAGVPFPPAELAFIGFKQEKLLEVWASAEVGGKAEHVATYGICAASGVLGPKRYEGDRQVPEGFYVIQYGWAESNYHLEMKVSYPNLVDKVLGPKSRPLGGEIMIHGACGSIGCLAMGDERAEELWTMMQAVGDRKVKVYLYPARDMDALLKDGDYAQHHGFWENLKEGKDRFEKDRRFLSVKADWHGVYMFE